VKIKLLKRLNEKHRVVMWEWYNKTFKIYYKDWGEVTVWGQVYQSEIPHYCKAYELYTASVNLKKWDRINIRVAIEKVNDMLDVASGYHVDPRRGWEETKNSVLRERRKSLSLMLQKWAEEEIRKRAEEDKCSPKLRRYKNK